MHAPVERDQRAARPAQLARYEQWIEEVERRRAELKRGRPSYSRVFVAMPIISLVGFAWGAGMGGGAVITATLASAFGFYTVLFRLAEYDRELEALRHDLRRLLDARDASLVDGTVEAARR